MLTFSDAWFGNIDAYLSTVESVYQLGERAAGVCVHLQVEDSLVLGQIAKECAIETLGKRVGRDFGNHQCLGHVGKPVEQVHNFTKGSLVGNGAIAVAAYFFEHRFIRLNRFFIIRFICAISVRSIHWNDLQTFKLTMMLLTF